MGVADEEFSIGFNEFEIQVKRSVKNRNWDLRGMARDVDRNLEILLLKLNNENSGTQNEYTKKL